MFTIKPKLKIVATILAKDEEDIIASTIEHHLKQGVWKIIFTDNNSSDNTRKIAASYPEVVEIIDEPGDDHNQSLWVTRMAQIACKFKPDWIVHLDADEHWSGLMNLSEIMTSVAGCRRMYLHPPINWNFKLSEMKNYLDFDKIQIEQECKIAHRPDSKFIIEHGNHGAKRDEFGEAVQFTDKVWRHHYPIRSYEQWERKSKGHEALKRRGAVCKRWQMWHEFSESGNLESQYRKIIDTWKSMIQKPNKEDLHELLNFWATPEMIDFFKKNNLTPDVRSL